MNLETYDDKYYDDIIHLIEQFQKDAVSEGLGELFEAKTMTDHFKQFKGPRSDGVFLMVIDGVCRGILYGVYVKSVMTDKQMFQEIIWYVLKEYRDHTRPFLELVENRLKSQGINDMILIVLENAKANKLKRFYESKGYRPIETHMIRTL